MLYVIKHLLPYGHIIICLYMLSVAIKLKLIITITIVHVVVVSSNYKKNYHGISHTEPSTDSILPFWAVLSVSVFPFFCGDSLHEYHFTQ